MNNKELILELSKRLGASKEEVSVMLDGFCNAVVSSVKKNETVIFQNFGSFELRKKQERSLFNPSTGKQMIVPPKYVIAFKYKKTSDKQ